MFSLIIPMYNEESILPATLQTLHTYMQANFDDYEILFSDDGSTDRSREIVETCGLPHVRVISYAKNRGKGCAVRQGMLAAKGDVRLFTDCDLAYGTEIIPQMFRAAVEVSEKDDKCAVMIGSRAIHKDGYAGYTFIRKLASKVFKKLLCTAAGFRHSDSQSGIKIFRHDAAKAIFPLCTVNGWAFDFEALMISEKLGYTIREYPVKVINHRESKINLMRDTFKMIHDVKEIKKRVDAM